MLSKKLNKAKVILRYPNKPYIFRAKDTVTIKPLEINGKIAEVIKKEGIGKSYKVAYNIGFCPYLFYMEFSPEDLELIGGESFKFKIINKAS